MLRDVFYYGNKPNVHPRERHAESLAHARELATTEHFWIINEFCDYRDFDWDFDFEFLPDEDVWAQEHNNVWPSYYQKDSGTWLCPKKFSEYIIYRNDVEPVKRKSEKHSAWVILDDVDESKIDFAWHPDPTDPPYIYRWGSKWCSPEIKPCLEYRVPGASDIKYMDTFVELLPEWEKWVISDDADKTSFDFSWRPDPREPPYIYVWGNKWIAGTVKSTIEYHTTGATQKKFIDDYRVKLLQKPELFEILKPVVNFDFSWRPDPSSPPYIYVWGNQWVEPELEATVIYRVENATEIKYMPERATLKSNFTNWQIPNNVDKNNFDFSWIPNPTEPPFIYQFGTQHQKTSGPRYIVPGATEVKYIDIQKATVLPDENNLKKFQVVKGFEIAEFDYSWHPDETESPYIYIFGNQHYTAEKMPTIRYVEEGATEVKYINSTIATLAPNMTNWVIPDNIDKTSFDFSWLPDPYSPSYIYQFGTQHQKTGGPRYVMPGATEIKYIDTQKVTALPNENNLKKFQVLNGFEIAEFDYSWHPDKTELPYIYVFGNQHYPATKMPTIRYVEEGAIETKYIDSVVATLALNMTNWIIPDNIDKTSFDFSWLPDPDEPPYIYEFATVWNNRGGPKYITPNATDKKYIEDIKARTVIDKTKWVIPKNIDVTSFDFSWVPHPEAPPYIYQFGTIEDKEDGPRYVVPNNNGEVVYLKRPTITSDKVFPKYTIKTTLEDLISEHADEIFWALNPDLDYSNFDFDWRPDIEQAQYIHAFGSEDNKDTQTYFVNGKMWQKGYRDINYVQTKIDIKTKLSMFFVDRGDPESTQRLEKLKEKYPDIQKTRYLNSWVDTINRCINKSSTNLCWILDSALDYTDFDFNYYPNPWQMKMIHVFGTQWSHWGTTYMINKDTFAEDTKWVKIIEHLSNLNFVKDRRAKATTVLYDFVVIDHGNREIDQVLQTIHEKAPARGMSTVKYDNSYFDTFKALIKTLPEKKEHYLWVCSSVCDYSNFDFSYICDPFAKDQLHVFPSDKQKYGDTFLIDVNRMKELINDMSVLDDYSKINFNQHQRVKRLPAPAFVNSEDTHVNIKEIDIDFPYAIVVTTDNKGLQVDDSEPISLWSPESKNILVTSTGGTRIIVPKEAKNYVKRELYDYPYIKKASKLAESRPLDIVYLSNGEKSADENYEHLLRVTEGLSNRIVRVDGVNGRVQAYHAAAEASETPWAFTVFAKLKVYHAFDWSWQPDRLQIPKHYIFEAMNPVNGLVYGHQAMIAYNKKLVLSNKGKGLDFTLDDEHEVVNMLSGTAYYNTDEFSTWRTAFREVIKLRNAVDIESKERLKIWLSKASGDFSEYSILGAKDAVSYYETVNGNIDKLKLSYEWVWLKDLFDSKYKK